MLFRYIYIYNDFIDDLEEKFFQVYIQRHHWRKVFARDNLWKQIEEIFWNKNHGYRNMMEGLEGNQKLNEEAKSDEHIL